MRQPDFWWRSTRGARIVAAALAPAGFLYGASVAWKKAHNQAYRARVPVICVGNLTVGGTGKTPVAIAIARLLQERGLSPVFLSRGYRGKTSVALVVEAESHDASIVGDEALLLARVAPTVVSPDRAWGARVAEALDTKTIIMDDGHQNFSVAKDLSFVVVDAGAGFGNGRIVPAGPLREPVEQGLRRADAVVLMGDGNPDLPGYTGPVLRARLDPEQRLNGRRVVAFAGIGRPEKFFATLRAAGADIVESHAYPDHHVYSRKDIARLTSRANKTDAQLVTTEKDFVRLAPGGREAVEVLPAHAFFEDAPALMRLLKRL